MYNCTKSKHKSLVFQKVEKTKMKRGEVSVDNALHFLNTANSSSEATQKRILLTILITFLLLGYARVYRNIMRGMRNFPIIYKLVLIWRDNSFGFPNFSFMNHSQIQTKNSINKVFSIMRHYVFPTRGQIEDYILKMRYIEDTRKRERFNKNPRN